MKQWYPSKNYFLAQIKISKSVVFGKAVKKKNSDVSLPHSHPMVFVGVCDNL